MPVLSIVICTLDEHEAIDSVLSELGEHLQDIQHEIIVVDDSSDERTGDAVNAYAAGDPRIRLVRRYNANGLSSAAITGWDLSKGKFLAIMDGDGQHDPSLMRGLLDKLACKDVDVAIASRYLDNSRSGLPGLRHILSRTGIRLTDTTLGIPMADPLSGCFAMTRDWYMQARSRLSGLGFKILIDVVASGPRLPRMAQIPTVLRARAGGASKLDTRVIVDLITLLIEKRTHGRFRAESVMHGATICATLVAQWLSASILLTLACPLRITLLLSAGLGLAGHLWIKYLMTSRSLRPHSLRDFARQWMGFYASRWSDLPLNAGVAITLCTLHCPWPLAITAGVLLLEAHYHTTDKGRVVA
ncbi:glycosyltransferase [Dyella caseinilytica]|uniref:Glycosyltransferase n=1 Tax=Dyella caseinilytica TaxID=1849581 RepID=A0ABX7GPL9_9GAMM|nr:glycosyltransferase [Dyella caseinilytica]QRN51933.1 glycosyltransferase [Dyella caseinilytica]GGA03741.1 dolichol monophosphate mannose synthase [Dyella caseinilytica]